ncbi:4'-phosphopantetheinyl transferase family protein [Ancylostoma caninum]|uniref:L-aminoadipate-semialdehyde dehydrogenase-phosphopantetheinyl transferase n=1 Tax=Ancylostoma caninum TaxID=29170 RepID=A0A368G7R8_ANCCA|nr:4'-phosphopantetheinyl transferase family protein [Ancylostoma caninum]
MGSLRWAVSLAESEACASFESLFRRALQCLPNEDVETQRRFRFRDDSLACVVGRLMIRQAARTVSALPWQTIEIGRSDRGKPYLANPNASLNFNVSHQGDLVVLASSESEKIGVDVMRSDDSRGSSALEHIERMSDLFTEGELRMMRSAGSEQEKWRAFYRIWCLKESVLKATGTGLVNDLRTLDFHTTEEQHVPGCFITSTTWSESGIKQNNWLFEESFVNENHCVAVARILPESEDATLERERTQKEKNFFSIVSFEHLLDGSSVVNPIEDGAAKEFAEYIRKSKKTW